MEDDLSFFYFMLVVLTLLMVGSLGFLFLLYAHWRNPETNELYSVEAYEERRQQPFGLREILIGTGLVVCFIVYSECRRQSSDETRQDKTNDTINQK